MDIGIIFLYCFYACIQVYIFMAIGVIAYYKKIFSPTSIKIISELLMVFILPIYGIIEISKIGTMSNLNILWILVVNLILAMGIAYLIARGIHHLFKLEERFSQTFSLMCATPSIGALPLVIGVAYCYPQGPLEGDPHCSNLLGLMMMCYLILALMIFIIAYILILSDKNLNAELTAKMEYIWHILIQKLFHKNLTVLYMFKKYFASTKIAEEKYQLFDEKFCLKPAGSGYILEANTNQSRTEMEKVSQLCHSSKDPKSIHSDQQKSGVSQILEQNNAMPTPIPKLLDHHLASNNVEFVIMYQATDSFFPHENLIKEIDFPQKERKNRAYSVQTNEFHTKKYMELISKIEEESSNQSKTHKSLDKEEQSHENVLLPEGDKISALEPTTHSVPIESVHQYYIQLFEFIENDAQNFNSKLRQEYNKEKNEIFNNISQQPPRFPIVRCVNIDKAALKVINEEWKIFEANVKVDHTNFQLNVQSTPLDMKLLMNKIYSPPILGCLLGLVLSISGLREIIFSKDHYISNVMDGLFYLEKVSVSFLFLLIGISVVSTKGLSMSTPLKKSHLIIIFIQRFLIIPGLGLLAIYLWSEVYGGEVKASKALRIILFFPWCLPSSATLAVIINMLRYFFEEYGYLILLQNLSCVVLLTFLYMIYFILVGL